MSQVLFRGVDGQSVARAGVFVLGEYAEAGLRIFCGEVCAYGVGEVNVYEV
ncbi:hypothetical protein I6J72_12970 (plasmid) [Corynebacterium sp. FDAARGOS 1242]|nr:hypothetical protein I6J72_12970 [Corynebacterium sp. FDAARGOS 1242]